MTGEYGVAPEFEWDMRKVFYDKNIHMVSFATPTVGITAGNIIYGTEGYVELKGEAGRPWKAFPTRVKVPFAGLKDDAWCCVNPRFTSIGDCVLSTYYNGSDLKYKSLQSLLSFMKATL